MEDSKTFCFTNRELCFTQSFGKFKRSFARLCLIKTNYNELLKDVNSDQSDDLFNDISEE